MIPRRALAIATIVALVGASPAAADRGRRRHARARPPAPVAAPPTDEARAAALREAGLERYLVGDFELAAADLMEAYRLDTRETTLFDWAEAVRATRDLDLAVRLYQRLLARTSDPTLAARARRGLAACAPPVVGIAPAVAPPRPIVRAAPPRVDHFGSYALVGAGALGALVGLGVYASGADRAPPGATHDVVTRARSDGDWRRVIGAAVATGGVVVGAIGLVRYRGDRRRERALALTPFASASRVGVALTGRF